MRTAVENSLRRTVRWYYARRATPRDEMVELWKGRLDGDHGLRLDYPLTPDSVVVDVGGYKGQWASDIYARFSCHVHVYEPVPAFVSLIEQRFEHNPKVVTHPYALGATSRWAQINLDEDRSSQHAEGGGGGGETIEVRAAVDELRALPRLDLVKLNIEGAEYELLNALDAEGMLGNVTYWQIQFHDFVPDAAARRRALLARLEETHEPMWSYPFVWESWRRR